jgi:putative glutamine amidotransferase
MSPAPALLVAITQRVVPVPSRAERRDTLDQSWTAFLHACGLEVVAVPNQHCDPVAYLVGLGVRGIILSGGGNISDAVGTLSGRPAAVMAAQTDLAPERDVTETALLRAAVEHGWPVLGVCRGMQVLNLFHGGRLAPVAGHAGTRHELSATAATGLPQVPKFDLEVNSFHDWGVPSDAVGLDLRVLATADGYAEAVVHEQLPQLGIMWHPERNRPFSATDIALFRDFFRTRASR